LILNSEEDDPREPKVMGATFKGCALDPISNVHEAHGRAARDQCTGFQNVLGPLLGQQLAADENERYVISETECSADPATRFRLPLRSLHEKPVVGRIRDQDYTVLRYAVCLVELLVPLADRQEQVHSGE
jgi:hypothetical protein